MLSELVTAYLFLGGTGAGCALISSGLSLLSDRGALDDALSERFASSTNKQWSRFIATGYLCAIAALALGSVCLFFDLGQPARLSHLFFPPKPSYLSIGAWSVVLCALSSVLCAACWLGALRIKRVLLLIASIFVVICALAVMLYTGLLLSDMASVPLWNTVWLVALFFLSALSCGMALFSFSAMLGHTAPYFTEPLSQLLKVDVLVILLEAIALAIILMSGYFGWGAADAAFSESTIAAKLASEDILFGNCAGIFWLGLVAIGLVVPLFCETILVAFGGLSSTTISAISKQWLVSISAVGVLVGGALLRWIVVAAALHPSLL